MTKTFQALDNNETDHWLNMAEMYHERGMFLQMPVYKLAELMYNKSIESRKEQQNAR